VADASPIVSKLGELIAARLEASSPASIADLYAAGASSLDLGPKLAAHVLRHRGALASWLRAAREAPSADAGLERSPVRSLAATFVRWLHAKNQFVVLDDQAIAELDALHVRSLVQVEKALSAEEPDDRVAAELARVVAAHWAGLAGFVRARLGDDPREVVCAEYSPALQLSVLGLRHIDLSSPVLDVGCGAGAALVRSLRAAKIDAHGIDRHAPADEPDVATVADWLSFPYGRRRWGTILSHQAFSLHFLHQHRAGTDAAFDYARAYMTIVRSLGEGGTFAYAPALPFIEEHLPASDYDREKIPLAKELLVPAVIAVQRATGIDLDYAMHVRRR